MKEIHQRRHQVSLVCRALSILSLFLFLNLSIISIHSFNNVNYTTLEELNLKKKREREKALLGESVSYQGLLLFLLVFMSIWGTQRF